MTGTSRRDFLRHALATGGAAFLGVVPLETVSAVRHDLHAAGATRRSRQRVPPPDACPDRPADGHRAGSVPFVGEGGNPPFGTVIGSGLDGRLYTDLSQLTPESLVTPTDRFFIRTTWPDLLDFAGPAAAWTVRVGGLVRGARAVALRELEAHVQTAGPFVMECAGNNDPANFGLMSAARWAGVPIARLLDLAGPLPRATRVKISGFDEHSRPSARSTPGASWVFARDQLESAGALLATGLNGERLPRDHGWPVRLVVPGWYGCTCIKWVNEITLLDESAPATAHMREFAARTFQVGAPDLAREYVPAAMDLAALPVRVEKWLAGRRIVYRVVGIVWGGTQVTSRLRIRFNPSGPYVPLEVCPPPTTTKTWTLWSHLWEPAAPGRYRIVLQPGDDAIASKRLDLLFYTRHVWIDEV